MGIAETGEIDALPHTASKKSVDSQGAERSGHAVSARGHEAVTQNNEGRGLIVNAQMCR
jgi:hypothetical protein